MLLLPGGKGLWLWALGCRLSGTPTPPRFGRADPTADSREPTAKSSEPTAGTSTQNIRHPALPGLLQRPRQVRHLAVGRAQRRSQLILILTGRFEAPGETFERRRERGGGRAVLGQSSRCLAAAGEK